MLIQNPRNHGMGWYLEMDVYKMISSSDCPRCGFYGIHEVEMFVKNAPLNKTQHEMWTEKRIKRIWN